MNKTASQNTAFTSDTLSSFQELVSIIASTNPPPAVPRVPDAHHGADAGVPELERRFQRILAQSKNYRKESRNIQNSGEQPPLLPELNQANATYGTTPAASIQILLGVLYPQMEANSKVKGSFVDAGSGQGIPTLAAALSGRFPLARGIEYQSKWHESALALKAAYEKEQEVTLQHQQKDCDEVEPGAACQLEYVCGDMTKPDVNYFVGASCVFLNGVTFDANMCQSISHRLEDELASNHDHNNNGDSEDVFVVSMSRQLALPSFDLVDVLSLNANGDGMFTFYVHRRAPSSIASAVSLYHRATSDSETMQMLREASTNVFGDDRKSAKSQKSNDSIGYGASTLLDELVNMALSMISNALPDNHDQSRRLGMSLLAALAASEPTVRQNMNPSLCPRLWEILEKCTLVSASLTEKALGSMVLRAMADHSIGRSIIANNHSLVDLFLVGVDNDDEHPAIRANVLDVLSQVLHDFPLTRVSKDLDQILLRISTMRDQESDPLPSNLSEALTEALAMQRWWGGHRKYIPNVPPIQE